MFAILTIIIIVITNNGLCTGAMKRHAVRNYVFRDSENWKVTSGVMQPDRLLNFSS